jgi:hypothetical protein
MRGNEALDVRGRSPQLLPKTKYEDIAAQVELERYRVKLPDRTARIIIESPTLAQLDPELEDFEGYQRRKATEEAKRAEMARVAEETGAPTHLLRALENRPPPPNIDSTAHDAQRERASQRGLEAETMQLDIAVRREQNVQAVANQAVQMINEVHLVNPIHEIIRARASPEEFILAERSDNLLPIARPSRTIVDTHVPAVPPREDFERAARALIEAGRTDTSSSLDSIMQGAEVIANAGAVLAPVLGMAAGRTGQALMYGARGTARVSGAMTSAATRGVSTAMSSLMQAGMPVQDRDRDHRERNGINIAQGLSHFMRAHRHLG